MVEIIPAILTDSPDKFKELVRKLEPYTGKIHIDIADGEFVPNRTVKGYEELSYIEAGVKFDVHLMVVKPQNQLQNWLHTYADRFIIHAESDANLNEIIENLKKHNRKVGLAVNPKTSLDKIDKFITGVDFIQFMTVYPGFQGGEFVNEVVDKISAFHQKYPDIIIMCDGGINPETAPSLIKAGASELVSGSYIVKSPNIGQAVERLRKAAEN
ncbi:MAG: hypothetical protein A2817_03025 [Candidatus Yanofskybacteria bacterium RIFCSPHIGHO2_01_FULL_39_8b]|uniref:Ribulose-phosphate 3-epimerase n=1 Tax=Candidatus Yanofskybacteria bacterium RIFCSPHIGHO2_01_FULL_39_8b TaxID=1802659 RepID=A0A1F8ED85_9BACT|nr:MAG: hypothetical protein A2817_03025 [Candidatus Yanofskybacteria bacterium RIFCSPHIGHO2_01_FULL_39_8b]